MAVWLLVVATLVMGDVLCVGGLQLVLRFAHHGTQWVEQILRDGRFGLVGSLRGCL